MRWFSPGHSTCHVWDPRSYHVCYSLIRVVARELTSNLVCQNKKTNKPAGPPVTASLTGVYLSTLHSSKLTRNTHITTRGAGEALV